MLRALLGYTVVEVCASPRNSIDTFLLVRGWGLGMRLSSGFLVEIGVFIEIFSVLDSERTASLLLQTLISPPCVRMWYHDWISNVVACLGSQCTHNSPERTVPIWNQNPFLFFKWHVPVMRSMPSYKQTSVADRYLILPRNLHVGRSRLLSCLLN